MDTQEEAGLRRLYGEPCLTDKILQEVATKLGCEWETLAVELNFTVTEVETIEKENQNDVVRQGLKMLVKWKHAQSTSVEEQITMLSTALKNIRRADIAGFLLPEPCLNDKILQEVATKLGRDWVELAVGLGFTVTQVETIEKDIKNDVVRQGLKMLVKWKHAQATSVEGQITKLSAALKNIRRADIAGFLLPGPWELKSCQEQLRMTYNSSDFISKHPTCTEDPLHLVDVDEFYTEIRLGQDDYSTVQKETVGNLTIDTAKTKPLDSLHDLLNSEKIKELLIILSGGAGHGKSTIFKRIVDTWAKSGLYSDCRLLFFIELKSMKTSCIIDAVFDQCFARDIKPQRKELIKIITDHPKESVFLLDGLDELRPGLLDLDENVKYCIYDLLHNKVLRGSRVLVATRPHKVQDIWKCKRRFALVHTYGFTSEGTNQYIKKHFTGDTKSTAEMLITCLQKKDLWKNMAQIPILCQIMCIVFSNYAELSDRVTTMYERFTKVLAQRRCPENEHREEVEKKLDSELKDLGEAAFQALISGVNELVLEFRDRTSVLETTSGESGFIQVETYTSSDFHRKIIVTFIHKTFQEYGAAYYFAHLYNHDEQGFRKRLQQINPDNVHALDYVLRFACGILKGSPATGLILEHVQKQLDKGESSKEVSLQKLVRLLLFESSSDKMAIKLDRPTNAECKSQEDLLAMHHYLQNLRQPLVELKEFTVHCGTHDGFALLSDINDRLRDSTELMLNFIITCRSHDDLKLLRDMVLSDNIRLGKRCSLWKTFLVCYVMCEQANEEVKTLEETLEKMDEGLRDQLQLTLNINELSHLDEDFALGSMSHVCNHIESVYLQNRTYEDIISVRDVLGEIDCHRLIFLSVSGTNLHGRLVGVAALVPWPLKSLILKSCGLKDDDVPDLISILPDGLRLLNVAGNAFSLGGVENLATHLRDLPKLAFLVLGYQGSDTEDFKKVAKQNLPKVSCV
ncbi:uncharacterized protein LOC119738634 [Patiria miniata]|uniref:Uncharacterized protein n=1 Tax=Patiria miniata TaxID=46514 RepID=A0A914B0G2_PATMI|nr:uncharacterized protein LOC119738634 [Patiria miniata]